MEEEFITLTSTSSTSTSTNDELTIPNYMTHMESQGLIYDTHTRLITSIGWYSNLNNKESYDTFTKFLKNATSPEKNKKWIYSQNHVEMDIYPKIGVYQDFSLDSTTIRSSNGCILFVTKNPDVWYESFISNGYHEFDIHVYSNAQKAKKFNVNYCKICIVTPDFLEKNKKSLSDEYWQRIVVTEISTLLMYFQKLDSSTFAHDFFWIVAPLTTRIESYHHIYIYCGIRYFFKKNSWIQKIIENRILDYIVIRDHKVPLNVDKIKHIYYNSYEAEESLGHHMNNEDYDYILCHRYNGKKDESIIFSSDFQCGVCLEEIPNEPLRCKLNPCNHNFCKKCISQWFMKSHQCPLCRNQRPNVLYTMYKHEIKRRVLTKTSAFHYYLESLQSTKENTVIFYQSDYHMERTYYGLNTFEYLTTEIIPCDFLENNKNIKNIIFMDKSMITMDKIQYFQINYPWIETFALFAYVSERSLEDMDINTSNIDEDIM